MHIVELTYPGTWLDYPDRNWCWNLEGQIRSLESTLTDAALALTLFDGERARPHSDRQDRRESWERDGRRRQEIEESVRARLGVDRYSMDRWDEVRNLSEVEFKREQWAAGRMPRSYEHRLIFLHARSFLYALDRLERCLDVLANEDGVPGEVAQSHAVLCAALPRLRDVRNSVSHFDERSRGLERGRPLSLQPVMNQMVHAPGGGVLIVESLNNNRFGGTMADGQYGEVEVSADTLAAATNCVQQVLNAFAWKGPQQHAPY